MSANWRYLLLPVQNEECIQFELIIRALLKISLQNSAWKYSTTLVRITFTFQTCPNRTFPNMWKAGINLISFYPPVFAQSNENHSAARTKYMQIMPLLVIIVSENNNSWKDNTSRLEKFPFIVYEYITQAFIVIPLESLMFFIPYGSCTNSILGTNWQVREHRNFTGNRLNLQTVSF